MTRSMERALRAGGTALAIALLGVLLLPASGPTWADDSADRGRALLGKWRSSIITVQMVTAVSMGQGSQKMEEKGEATGTVIDPSGLVVLSLTSSDPSSAFEGMMPDGFSMETEVTDVKIRLPDGDELPAEIVLRDKDLDLVFVRPNEKPGEPLQAVDLADSARLRVLDEVVILNRLGSLANWTTSAKLERVQAVVGKPRTYYVLGEEIALGAPVFALDGKIVGIMTLRTAVGRPSMGGLLRGMSGLGMMPVVLPAEDIAEVAEQVPKSGEE